MIKNINDLASQYFGLDVAHHHVMKKALYRDTNCGAWIEFEDAGIKVGSIVEGLDFGTNIYPLSYPFTSEDLEKRVQAIEAEAHALWVWCNEDGCEGDAPDVGWDYQHLDPDGVSS